MNKPDTDEYYSNGVKGELSNRQYAQRERDKAIERMKGELEDAKNCLTQAAASLVTVEALLEEVA